MNIFLDTNIILDVLICNGRNNREASLRIIDAARANNELNAFVSTQSLSDAAYLFTKSKKTDNKRFYKPVSKLLVFINLASVNPSHATLALDGLFPDYEDEVQLRCAIDAKCSFFITSDKQILERQPFDQIKAIHPAVFLELASRGR